MDTRLSGVQFGLLLVCWGVLLAGCHGKGRPPEVEQGKFTARVQGTLDDTITGAARYRATGDTLQAFELGRREGAGMSVELEPRSKGLYTYEVVEAEVFGTRRPEQGPGVMSFLTIGNGRFTAVDGALTITYVNDEQVGAEFSFFMEGEFDGAPVDGPSVDVTGAFNAFPEQ